MATAREALVRIQKKLYRHNKSLIEQSVQITEPQFVAYERRYRRAVATYQKAVAHKTMLRAIHRADIVYVGDYHTCAQSQRSFLRILKAMAEEPQRPLMIGLELIHSRYQTSVDAYLQGNLSDEQFLHTVGLQQHWIFDLWDNFRPLFDFARYHNMRIFGIDAASRNADLAERDAASGKCIARLSKQYPDHQMFVLIGDLHLAPQHLPRDTQQALQALHVERRDVILYQNSESIYWRLAREGREHRVGAVQINKRSFCRMHTPPIVCQQSYLNWLDHEEGEIDFADAKHQFLDLVDRIARFLKIPLGAEKDDVAVYTCGDLSFLEVLRRRKSFSAHELKTIRRHVLASESYCVPQERIVYLANLSLNHAGEEASHYVKYLCSGQEFPRPLVDAFYANVLHEALGFFGSKLISHNRKCLHEDDFRKLRNYFRRHGTAAERQLESDTASLVLEYLKYEQKGKPLACKAVFQQPADHFFAITHALGYMLGDAMFYGVIGHKLRRPYVCKLFTEPWRREHQTFDVYMDLRKRLKKVTIPKRM